MNNLPLKLTAVAFALSVSFSASADHHGETATTTATDGTMSESGMPTEGMNHNGMEGSSMMMSSIRCPMKLYRKQFSAENVTLDEVSIMPVMYEKEKLAMEVYKTLIAKWDKPVFEKVGKSESMHMWRINIFLDVNNIAIPSLALSTSDTTGTEVRFTSESLQTRYDELVKQGDISELDAYKVGALIEETSISELEAVLAKTTNPDLKTMYGHLKMSSSGHLRKLNAEIVKLEETYTPTVLSQAAFDKIINAEMKPMVVGNAISTLEGKAATDSCFVSYLGANGHELQNGSILNPNQTIKISYAVDIEAGDVGKMADWLIVAGYTVDNVTSFFARNGANWEAWNGEMDQLPASMTGMALEATKSLSILEAPFLATGDYAIYAGYRLEDKLVYKPAPLQFSISDKADIAMHHMNENFMSDTQHFLGMHKHDMNEMPTTMGTQTKEDCGENQHFMSDTKTCMNNNHDMSEMPTTMGTQTKEDCGENQHFMSDTQTCMNNDHDMTATTTVSNM